jgi:hypothetical protein
MDERFEMTALFEDYPRKNLYVLEVSDDGYLIEVINDSWTKDGLNRLDSATIQYNGSDRYIWGIRIGDPDPETGQPPVTFRDTVTRR